MKQPVLRVTLIICLLITSLLWSGTAYAQDEELPDPGLTPDSPFYFFDTWGKNIGMFFTFGDEAKARKALEYAEERLAEAQAMATANRTREMTRAANDYDEFLAMVCEKAERARLQGASDNISERVASAISKHLSVWDKLKDRVPEKAREAINRARTATMNRQRNALRALAKIKPERAMEINADAIEKRLNRARIKATENITAEVEASLADAAELVEIEDEISEIAQGLGWDISAIEERLAHSTSNRFEVLAEIYEKVPEPARPAIASALENSIRKYERVIEKIREKSASGEIPEEAQVLQRASEELRERWQLMISNAAVSDNASANATWARTQAQVEEKVRERLKIKPETPEPASANETKYRQEDTETSRVRERSFDALTNAEVSGS